MEKQEQTYIGVDISKAKFDIYFKSATGQETKAKLDNNAAGFAELLSHLPSEPWVVMEASGPYYYQLACFLYDQGITVSVVNPLVIKRFSQMQLSRTKTDSADAKSIAEYGSLLQMNPWKPLKACYLEIKQWYAYRKQLLKHRHAVQMKLEAFVSTGELNSLLRESIDDELFRLDENIKGVDRHLDRLIEQENSQLREQLESVPGIGPKTSLLLIVALRGFEDFQNYKQVISYLGLSPRIYESGTSVKGKAKICKMGMSEVRKCLYMAARSARAYNKACTELYTRLRAKGKAHRVAMVAVVNKLIKQAFTIVRSDGYYVQDHYTTRVVTK